MSDRNSETEEARKKKKDGNSRGAARMRKIDARSKRRSEREKTVRKKKG